MKKKNLLLSLVFGSFLLNGCTININNNSISNISSIEESGKLDTPLDTYIDIENNPNIKYSETNILIKSEFHINKITEGLKDIGLKSIKTISSNQSSNWHIATINESENIHKVIKTLREKTNFEYVDYDYIYENSVIKNVNYDNKDETKLTYNGDYQKYLNIDDTWKYMENNDGIAGGKESVVIAVIDSGVDYNHPDLISNIWINTAEIPNNNIDDDNNGYIDDINGIDCVGDTVNPMDDNGHGTHVAGIIAASNNDFGVTGVAYNCKIMPIKAANSSGYLLQSDIAEAINYAYMNGADIINMSFGGSSISLAVQEALENAYNSCLLVASAGNDSAQNEEEFAGIPVITNYPAALPFVCGVMSCNNYGIESQFTNFDVTPNNKIEYEVYAPGEQILSTMPNGKYAKMSGTSMSAPVVSGIAALLRSQYSSRDLYPTKFIFSQLVNTSEDYPVLIFPNMLEPHKNVAPIIDAYEAMTKAPKPSVSKYDYYTFDSKEINGNNNDDGIIDAGETIHIGLELTNKGGMASNVVSTINVERAEGVYDPYITINKASIDMGSIGTYSIKDGGKIYNEDNKLIDVNNAFEITISPACPNDYICNINVVTTYKNGLDEKDTGTYLVNDTIQIIISSGEKLPNVIKEDTTLSKGKKYILSENMVIDENVTLTVEPGVDIQYYANTQSYYNTLVNTPKIIVYGTLNCIGTEEEMINIYPSDLFEHYACEIQGNNTYFNYCHIVNPYIDCVFLTNSSIENSIIDENKNDNGCIYKVSEGKHLQYECLISFAVIKNTAFNIFSTPSKDSSFAYTTIYCSNFESNIFNLYNNISSLYVLISTYLSFCNNVINNVSNNYQNDFVSGLYIMVKSSDCIINNNTFINYSPFEGDIVRYFKFMIDTDEDVSITNTYWAQLPSEYIDDLILDYYDGHSNGKADYSQNDNIDFSSQWPFIYDVKVKNLNDEYVEKVGNEEVTFEVYFSRDMDTSIDLNVAFGSMEPYADYKVKGEYIDKKTWVGSYKINTIIENGTQRFRITNARADTEHFKVLYDDGCRFSFEIDTTGAQAMNLQAVSTENGVELTWMQDDYDTLMGYNLYRSETKDGNYTKINTSVIPAGENTFLDENAEPGKNYWYTFTVVFSDFSESRPSGKTTVTTLDTINPNIYHTPVNQGYLGNNLLIKCTATDNVSVTEAKLYYRVKGSDSYNYVTMVKNNDSFVGKISGDELSLLGMEYYITVSDGVNIVYKGSAEDPYEVIIKDASSISYKGDVDGDGNITTKDALMIMQHISGEVLLTDDQFKRADLNNDEVLSSSEALRILQYINGKVTTLEM